MRGRRVLVVVLSVGVLWSWAGVADLQSYVARQDGAFAYEVHSSAKLGENDLLMVHLTSQKWQNIVWKHWLGVIVPREIKHPDMAFLLIMGGRNRETPPATLDSQEARAVSAVAARTGSVVAVLSQVPNQPLFDGLREDALISYTYEKFLSEGGDDWPLLQPMTKSAVKAMDAVQAVVKDKFGHDITRFCVSGASKRGWTTWLTGAVDPRVAGIAPMVIDVLNMGPQMQHQLKVYGAYSGQIDDYTERGIQSFIDTPGGQKLLKLVDPFAYRDKLTMPKLVLLGTNDEYWCVDSSQFYFPELKGEKHLRYEPNAGHGLGLGVAPAIMGFYSSLLEQKPLPKYGWKRLPEGGLEVTWEAEGVTPRLWQAHSPNRDFRQARWTSTDLDGAGNACVAQLDAPETGWLAYYVELVFPGGNGLMPYGFTTEMTVTPDTFPDHAAQETSAQP